MDFLTRVNPELRDSLLSVPIVELPHGLDEARQIPTPPTGASELVRTTEQLICGGDGQQMLIKIYQPAERDGTQLPALLWIHGGGYVLGHPNNDDTLCEKFVEAAGCVVVSPNYRLAPEHPYPAAIEDCYATLVWMTQATAELNIDLPRIAIGGGSAGGGLTAALALLARDRGGPSVCFQMPLYPMIDDRNNTFSSHEITDTQAIWYRSNNLAAWKMYLGCQESGEIPPYAAPTRAENLEGLPPTYTCVGQLDPFRDETIDYVTRLAEAGIDVEFHLYPGCFHAFEHVVQHAEVSQRAKDGYIQALKRALSR
ncbi:alpha/beta hydrolase [Alicyclobacillus dauci]|uniref:Alpha/beta hydrolase n=1 Tax=Alicyclobacillus dauci TaxID=1475485 RepID=A0ABY6Z2U1_9BACL|nr:alpha/beta hydrolase fold domain-containing protein [Alicyclobacillus dauci]WAH37060.1 alpha/beta hydrolase [Alicyclobacillus dauci]